LANCTQLKTLDLSYNNIRDISALEKCTELTTLTLSNNNIENISAVSKLTKLKELALDNNKITDMLPVKGLDSLTSLSLRNNKITDVTGMDTAFKEDIEITIDLTGNDIKDWTPLRKYTKATINGMPEKDSSDTSSDASSGNASA